LCCHEVSAIISIIEEQLFRNMNYICTTVQDYMFEHGSIKMLKSTKGNLLEQE